jgi:hypothetical protein
MNLVIYHCLACGAVAHREPDREKPLCCGKPMINAAAETVFIEECQVIEIKKAAADAPALDTGGRQKPR